MWKKPEAQENPRSNPAPERPQAPTVQQTESNRQPPAVAAGEKPMSERASERAIIGPSIAIKGDVTGEEDLLIQGRIEGKVDLKQHSVTIGSNGRIKADVHGRTVTVEGEVEGDLHGEEQIVVRRSGRVRGNVVAPRVTIEDGAVFQGSIDMSRKPEAGKAPQPAQPAAVGSSLANREPEIKQSAKTA
jgi:cytoskeletal protein CcmA (bactofilin family)